MPKPFSASAAMPPLAAPRRTRDKTLASFDLTRARPCVILFLILAIPTLVGVSLLAGPLQTLDESSHFYRAVQLSEGRLLPVVAPGGRQAGDYLDVNLHRLGEYFLFLSYTDWWTPFGAGQQDKTAAWATTLQGRNEFVAFSNTVIYFPLAHAVPALAIAVLRALRAPPMAWIYGGRLANVAVAILVFCLAIAWFPEGRVFVFVLALLPRTVFGTAALSADALLVPFAALFAALVARLSEQGRLSPRNYGLLFVSMLFVCLGKIAYVPLAAIPPVTALAANRRVGSPVLIPGALSALTIVVWLAWLLAIRHDLFPIRSDVHIDVYAQLFHVLRRPWHGIAVLLRTLRQSGSGYADNLIGGQLGSNQARFPYAFVALTWAALLAGACMGRAQPTRRASEVAATLLIVSGASIAVFLLLYMQFSALDAPVVDGVQGRYFLPLMPALVAFLPKLDVGSRASRIAGPVIVCWMLVASATTVDLMKARYWHSKPVEDQRFGDPHNLKVE